MVKKAKPGLGKGLDLLIPKSEPVEEKKTADPQVLKISQVEPNRNQPRKQFDKESLQELAGSIDRKSVV